MQQRSKRSRGGADRPKPLYRKVNTRARNVHHHIGPDASWARGTKTETEDIAAGITRGKMVQGRQRGLDYTPLYRFLLKHVGQPFDQVMSAALPRLPSEEPIWHIVHPRREGAPYIRRAGEASYWSGLYVDDDGLLQKVAPDLRVEDIPPLCSCCSHSFNGMPLTRAALPFPRHQSAWRALNARYRD